MKKLILEVQTSIDGFVAAEDGSTSWMSWNWGEDWTWTPELQQYHNELTAATECILLSRKMAEEGFIHHWAGMAQKAGSAVQGFAQKITDLPKVVFTKTLDESRWDNTTLAKGNLVQEINALKARYNLIAYGGAGFAASLISAGVVDEIHLLVNPVAIGKGMPIFNKVKGTLPLTLISSTAYSNGMMLVKYKTST